MKHKWRILGANSYICYECGARATAGQLVATACKPYKEQYYVLVYIPIPKALRKLFHYKSVVRKVS